MQPKLFSVTPRQARNYAILAHGDQRYGNAPYSVHLDAVAEILRPYGADAQIVGYLHDVLEDTTVTPDELSLSFGDKIAECVELVTDEPAMSRKARKLLTNAKLAKVTGDMQLALIVKAADRLANVREASRSGLLWSLQRYRDEHKDFRKAAYRRGLCDELWEEIDRILS